MYKKIYTIYNEGAAFCCFLFFLFHGGGVIFSKTELADIGEAPQCYRFSNGLCCILCCCHDNTLWPPPPNGAQDKTGPALNRLRPPLTIQGNNNNTQTFVNCMQQNGKLYHYFKIVYVKVIFLHVDCCYFVF